MMRRRSLLACGTLLLAAALPWKGVLADDAGSASALFGKPVVLRGTLGDMTIQASVRPKPDAEGGLEGEYFVFGRGQRILLAGEMEGEDVVMEESQNGTDVSGDWEGKLKGDIFRGKWLSADGKLSLPFELKAIKPAQEGARAR